MILDRNENYITSRYDQVQRIVNEWWRLWIKNFSPNLLVRGKWFKTRENICMGDIVLEMDPDIKRSQWKMAVVVDI